MYPRRMMVVGSILVVSAVAIFVLAVTMARDEENLIGRAVPFNGATGAVKQGDLVVVEGKVSAKNKILIHDFVDAASERQIKGGSWTTLKLFRQPVLADLANGEIMLNADFPCAGAKGNNVLMTGEKTEGNREIRYIGLRRGDPVTAVGTLASVNPASLTVKNWYSGSVSEYRESLSSTGRNSYIFCAILVITGAGMFALGFRKR